MKKMNTLARYGAGAVGAIALTLGGVGVAGAQDEPESEPAPTEEDAGEASERRSERRDGRRADREARKAELAEVLNVSVDDLVAARQGGESLADIAGEDVTALVTHLTNAAEERIAAKVESGRITTEQADEHLENLDERIDTRINNTELRSSEERQERRGERRAERRGERQAERAETAESTDS